MIKNWNLAELHQKGMKHESAAAMEKNVSGCEVKLMFILIKELEAKKTKLPTKKCYRCDLPFSTKDIKEC